jgi:hypothetical protein
VPPDHAVGIDEVGDVRDPVGHLADRVLLVQTAHPDGQSHEL